MPPPPAPQPTQTECIVADLLATRSPLPVERLSPRLVGQLLANGWTEAEVRAALATAPAWSPGSIQVELRHQTGRTAGRNGHRVKDAGDTDAAPYIAAIDGTPRQGRTRT
jgi:hypothetical protein